MTCDYMLEASRLAQLKEAQAIIADHSTSVSIPGHIQQQLGEVLDKKRLYNVAEYPELLVYEYLTGNMLRENQAQKNTGNHYAH